MVIVGPDQYGQGRKNKTVNPRDAKRSRMEQSNPTRYHEKIEKTLHAIPLSISIFELDCNRLH